MEERKKLGPFGVILLVLLALLLLVVELYLKLLVRYFLLTYQLNHHDGKL